MSATAACASPPGRPGRTLSDAPHDGHDGGIIALPSFTPCIPGAPLSRTEPAFDEEAHGILLLNFTGI
jgi:hypothetical protein